MWHGMCVHACSHGVISFVPAQDFAPHSARLAVRLRGSRRDAYMLCSLAGNLRVTQLVDGNKGVHMMLAKVHL
jgi:hypothetical protein